MTNSQKPSHPRGGAPAPLEPELRRRLERLVADCLGAELSEISPVEAGLDTRRFFRMKLLGAQPATLIARVSTPEDDSLRPAGVLPEPANEPIRAFLEANEIPVARRYGGDPDIELLEDLGDTSLERFAATATASRRQHAYSQACAIAARIQTLAAPSPPIAAFQRRLDENLFRYKAAQVIEWALPWSHGRPTHPSEAQVVRDAFEYVASECRAAPQRLSHRDYKAANLLLRSGSLALIDVQGALLAPPEYDFVCLLRDSHVALPDAEVAAHLDAVRPNLPDAPSASEFERRFTLLTLTRVGKDLSRYLYAARERGDERYLRFVPEAARNLRAAAGRCSGWDPRLERLAELFSQLPDSSPGENHHTGSR